MTSAENVEDAPLPPTKTELLVLDAVEAFAEVEDEAEEEITGACPKSSGCVVLRGDTVALLDLCSDERASLREGDIVPERTRREPPAEKSLAEPEENFDADVDVDMDMETPLGRALRLWGRSVSSSVLEPSESLSPCTGIRLRVSHILRCSSTIAGSTEEEELAALMTELLLLPLGPAPTPPLTKPLNPNPPDSPSVMLRDFVHCNSRFSS